MTGTIESTRIQQEKKPFGQLIHNPNPDLQHITQKLERHNKKLNRQTLSVEFNKTCLN